MGLPETIISSAKNVLSREDRRFEDIITDLEISRKTVILEQERAEAIRLEAEKLKKEFEASKDKLNAQREKFITEAKEEARQVFQKAEAEAGALIKEMHKISTEQSERVFMHEARQQLKEKISEYAPAVTESVKPGLVPIKLPVEKNAKVFIGSFNKSAIMVNPPDANGDAMIHMGVMRMKVHVSDIFELPDEQKKTQGAGGFTSAIKSSTMRPEIDLRGMMTEEGLEACDKYIDDAYLSSLEKVTLIHGKGTGALRKAIHVFLKSDPRVASFRLGKFGEGEDGVTIVELKKEN